MCELTVFVLVKYGIRSLTFHQSLSSERIHTRAKCIHSKHQTLYFIIFYSTPPSFNKFIWLVCANKLRKKKLCLRLILFFLLTRVLNVLLQIIKIPVEECSNRTTCQSCVEGGDPYCGWCTLSARYILKKLIKKVENYFI